MIDITRAGWGPDVDSFISHLREPELGAMLLR